MGIRRRALTLLEVLIAAVLAGGLFAVLFKSWVQLESVALAAHRTAHEVARDYSTRLWLQDHLSRVIVRGDRAALSWDGEVLEVTCIHGSHQDPRLAGPVRLQVKLQDGSLLAVMASDEELWQTGSVQQQIVLWESVSAFQLAIFGQLEDEQYPSWHQGHQVWPDVPLFGELRIARANGWTALPIYFMRDES